MNVNLLVASTVDRTAMRMLTSMDPDPAVALAQRFASILKARRGLRRQIDVQQAGGPSGPTLRKYESGTCLEPPSAQIFQKLDKGLRWTPGSAVHAWSGGDPVPLEGAGRPLVGQTPFASDSRSTPGRDVAEVRELKRRLGQSLAEQSRVHGSLLPQLEQSYAAFVRFADKLVADYAIGFFELNGGPGRTPHELGEIAFGSFLSEVAEQEPSGDAAAAENRNYLLWLAGRITVDSETATRFASRHAESLDRVEK
ncbi:hypothetical protein [Antrihabitans spumae]|uniref:Uncharacterized protein n=1 Tax=Antrihabitans spumae TaxID=3373370 RepID=A0ABW7KP75_9NOCA